MRIDGSFINYWFERACMQVGAITYLCTEYQLSDVEGYSLLNYLEKQDNVTSESLPLIVQKWQRNTPNPSYDDYVEADESNLVTLLPLFGIHEEYYKNENAEIVYRALGGGTPKGAGSLGIIINDIAWFFRAIESWGQFNLHRYVSLNYHPLLFGKSNNLSSQSKSIKKLAECARLYENSHQDVIEKKIIKLSGKNEGLANLYRLFFSDGFSFNEKSNNECVSAIVWLKSIHDYINAIEGQLCTLDIMHLIAEKNIITNDPYLDLMCSYLLYQTASGYLEDISKEFGSTKSEKGLPNKQSRGGRGKGTWHTDVNKLEDVIWSSIFSKIWNGRLKMMISEYNLNGRKTEQRLKDIPLLGAAHLYLALKKEGLAKAYGKNGTKNSFYKAVKEAFSYRRQSLDEYMLLIDLVDNINIAIENELQNDNFKNQGYEKADQGADGEVSMHGKMRIAKGNASLVWAPELAAFRKEHYKLYSLLGDDILFADYTVEKDLEDYPNNNIHKMIETLSWLQREIHREYSNLTSK